MGVPLGLFSLSQYRYLDISGKKLPQGLLDIGQVAGGDDIPLKVRWGIKGQPVGGEGEGFGVVKPGIQRGGGKGTLHQRQDPVPNLGGGIHHVQFLFLSPKTARTQPGGDGFLMFIYLEV